jgi:hypothetical protein
MSRGTVIISRDFDEGPSKVRLKEVFLMGVSKLTIEAEALVGALQA